MSKQKTFNWDKYVLNAPYSEVLDGMGGARLTMPTMFSPDRKKIYLKSHDIAIGTDDIELLSWAFAETYNNLRQAVASMSWSCEDAYLLQVDYLIVWSLLSELDALPDDYQHPEHYLGKIWQEIRPGKQDQINDSKQQ